MLGVLQGSSLSGRTQGDLVPGLRAPRHGDASLTRAKLASLYSQPQGGFHWFTVFASLSP